MRHRVEFRKIVKPPTKSMTAGIAPTDNNRINRARLCHDVPRRCLARLGQAAIADTIAKRQIELRGHHRDIGIDSLPTNPITRPIGYVSHT